MKNQKSKRKKVAVVGSRKMSLYGRQVIAMLIPNLVEVAEVVTIRVGGCNAEIIRQGAQKIIEGEDFYKLNNELAEYADILVIIEGGKNSGTILLAQIFADQGKVVYCIPGRVTDENSWVPNWLIENGAEMVNDLEILVNDMS